MNVYHSAPKAEHEAVSPTHYTSSSGTQLWDAMRDQFTKAEFMGYLKGNVWKYTSRYDKKNGIEDLKKAAAYINKMIETLENE